eukprot:6404895-Pyramimonas_sp.AAC.1
MKSRSCRIKLHVRCVALRCVAASCVCFALRFAALRCAAEAPLPRGKGAARRGCPRSQGLASNCHKANPNVVLNAVG